MPQATSRRALRGFELLGPLYELLSHYSVCILEGPCENQEGQHETRAKDSGGCPDKQTKINPPNHPTPERPTLCLG